MRSAAVLLSVLLVAGCASPGYRIKHHPELYSALPARQQQLVRTGQIDEGMTRDAVYLAYGRPDQIRQEQFAGATRERWIYFGNATEYVPAWRSGPWPYYPYGVRPIVDFVPVTIPYYWKSVTFESGVVIAWDAPAR